MHSLKVGDKVIYPAQGLGVIEDIQEETYNGQLVRTFYIRLAINNTLVVIPSNSAAEIGLRRPVSQKNVNKFFQYLRKCSVDISTDWKDRYKENFDLMKSGQLEDIAQVYKMLFLLSQSKPLSFREKKMLEKSRELIICELAASSGLHPSKISAKLDQCLAGCLKDLKSGSAS
ncbi:MAG: CarD-like transcriptional regulator [Candidatus Saccharicenans subterraneus]|uniref:CarD-like transcriptional regulator n=1 Tax=Candidatus Saccharicenans subterraneus TaxID=2508984 RepID=A0A3E2BPZ5_9BACT|nr:MAG: CarD-like transcriptional regulator [Candidatus Saccharicenans subterraneum]